MKYALQVTNGNIIEFTLIICNRLGLVVRF